MSNKYDYYDYKYDRYVDDPTPYKALDGSYHATREEAEVSNSLYVNRVIDFITDPVLDIPLTQTQLEQIMLNPSINTLLSILRYAMQQQYGENKEKGLLK